MSATPALAVAGTISEFSIPTAASLPFGITAGPDGALWFIEQVGNKIGRITTAGSFSEFAVPTPASQPVGITAGPDGALWFTEQGGNKIGRITTAGSFSEFSVPTANSFPQFITVGPDGALWFTELAGDKIGRITTAGSFSEFSVPTAISEPVGIIAGPDGALWFTEHLGNKIGRITTAGTISEFAVPTAPGFPVGITAGPDGALWFTESSAVGNKIGRITTAGSFTEFAVPTAQSTPFEITAGPDGALWFTEQDGNKIGRITTAGSFSEFSVPTAASAPFGITAGPDGALWFTEFLGNKIGRISVQVVPARYLPSRDGYQFDNPGRLTVTVPTYDQMASYYPASRDKIYQASGGRTNVGKLFYALFAPTFNQGLCYGMATSDTYLYNRASPPPGTNGRWTLLTDLFAGDALTPPVTTGDQTIEQFIDRYHARMYAAAAAQSSINVWNSVGRNIGTSNNRTQGNLAAFDQIAAQVQSRPQVVALGPSPFILSGGPQAIIVPLPLPNPVRFWTLFNNSHAVVAYDTLRKSDGTRVIKVYDPSSANLAQRVVIDDARIEVAGDGSVKLIDFADGSDANGNPKTWIGGGVDSQGRDMGQPGDWILMPLQDADFSDGGNIAGADNRHWVIPDGVATAINLLNAPRFMLGGLPLMHFSGPGAGGSAVTLPAGTTYDNTITAMGSPALTAVTINGHLVTATQTDANAAGSSHHLVVDPAATSIHLDSATQMETFTLEIGGDYLPAFSRKITMPGLTLAPSQSLNLASDPQTSGLTISASSATATVVSATFEQTGASPGQATVQVTVPASSISATVPASSISATVSIFDWNSLGTSLISEVIDAQGTPRGQILQGNPGQLQTQISKDLASLQNTIATIADPGLRNSLQVKVAHAQDQFARGQTTPAANSLGAMRNEVDAQAGKKLSDATAATLRQWSADALVLLAAS